jgi:Protein of unknown function (DUF2877)
MRAMLLSIGDRVEPGQYELHSRFEHACNFSRGARLVCVVDQSVGAGPLNLVLAGFREVVAPSLYVGSDSIMAGNRRLTFNEGRRYHSALRIAHSDTPGFLRNVSHFRKSLLRTAPAASLAFLIDETRTTHLSPGFARTLTREMARSACEFFNGDLFAGIAGLKGCGPGLTPSGDDFLAGVLTGLHVVQQMRQRNFRDVLDTIFAAATGDNLFSNNFLDMARRGLVSEHVQTLIAALVAGGADEVAAATRKLLAVGSTSGADFATGLYMTIHDEGEFATRNEKPSCVARVSDPGARVRDPRHTNDVQVGACS